MRGNRRKGNRRRMREGKRREGKGEGKGREGKGREGKGREGKGREGKGREGKGREGKGREGKSREPRQVEGMGDERKEKDRILRKDPKLSFIPIEISRLGVFHKEDQIVSINGCFIKDYSLAQVVEILGKCGSRIKLEFLSIHVPKNLDGPVMTDSPRYSITFVVGFRI